MLNAQIPFFASTAGDNRLYGYASLKARPGINTLESYSCFQYGIGDHFAAGTDITTGTGAYLGFLLRYGHTFNPWFGIGAQVTPAFNLQYKFQYSYTTVGIYMNGQILPSGKLFWCSNTWLGLNRQAANTYFNWEYLGLRIHNFTPMLGLIHSWKFDQDLDIAVGFYNKIGRFNLYLWGNDFLKPHPRLVAGFDFLL